MKFCAKRQRAKALYNYSKFVFVTPEVTVTVIRNSQCKTHLWNSKFWLGINKSFTITQTKLLTLSTTFNYKLQQLTKNI